MKYSLRKSFYLGLILAMIINILSVIHPIVVQAADDIRLQVNGEIVDLGREPLLVENRLLIPARVAEVFGAIVHWEPADQTVTISDSSKVIVLVIGDQRAMVAGNEVLMDVPAQLFNQATYVPLRFLGEALGVQVNYYSEQNLVTADFPVKVSIGSIKRLTSGVELEISGQGKFGYTTMILSNPNRYVIDLQNTLLEQKEGTLSVNTAGISTIRYAHHDTATPYTRVVLDLEGSTQGLTLGMSSDGKTLVIGSSFYYISSIRNQRLGNGEEITFTLDGRITPQIETKYLNSAGGSSVDLIDMKPPSLSGDRAVKSASSSASSGVASSSASAPSSASITASLSSSSVIPEVYEDDILEVVALPSDEVIETTPSETAADVITSMVHEYTATTLDDLNFRKGPGKQYELIKTLPTGTTALLLQRQGEWAYLRLDDDSEGWCNSDYLEFGQRDVPQRPAMTASTPAEPSNPSNAPATPGVPQGTSTASNQPSSASTAVSLPSSNAVLPSSSVADRTLSDSMKALQDTEFGYGNSFRIYLPGVFPQIPSGFKATTDTLIQSMSLTDAPDGAWLNIQLKTEMPYQVSMVHNQLEIALNLDTKLHKLEFSKDASGSTITLSMSRTVGYDVAFLTNPDRVEITIPGAAVVNVPAQQLVRDGLISQITTSTTTENAKVTIELEYMIGYRVLSDSRSDKIELKLYTRGLTGKTIFLDPGHGGSPLIDKGDRGAVTKTNPIFYESTGTLDIALRLKALLEEAGVTVLMTRSTDQAVDIYERAPMANASSADVLLSIHHNSATNSSANGLETYYWEQTADRKRLAETLQKHLVNNLKLTDRGVKRAAFYPINYATMPSALVELAFLSNPLEEILIRDEIWRQRVANTLFEALKEFFD